MNENIKDLVLAWEDAAKTMMTKREFTVKQIEYLLRETYRVCYEHKNKDTVPKELCKIFTEIERFTFYGASVYYLDEFTTSSDTAEFDAIAYTLDEIEYGFYEGKYECAFPYINVESSNRKSYTLNLEEDFLEFFIDENR